MPSSSIPDSTVAPGPGPVTSGSGGAGNNVALLAHISDPADAHPATAIGYAGGPVWADGTGNPATTVEAQLDKIIAELADRTGELKIGSESFAIGSVNLPVSTLQARLQALVLASNHHYVSGPIWADATPNPVNTVEGQLDKIVTDLAATTGSSGADKLGGRSHSFAPIFTIPAGTLYDQLDLAYQGRYCLIDDGPAWRDSETNPADDAEAFVHAIISDLSNGPAGAGFSGATKVGVAQRAAWLGGRPNPGNISVQEALDKVVFDLGVSGAADDGAERIGSAARTHLLVGSVASQLAQLETDWGKLDRLNTWTNTNTLEGPAGDTNPILITDTLPTNRKLVWRIRSQTAPTVVYTRLYFEQGTNATVWTFNAGWNGTNWVADDNTVEASSVAWIGAGSGYTDHRVKSNTSVAWAEGNWTYYSRTSPLNLALATNAPAGVAGNISARNGNIFFPNAQSALGSDTNPPATQGHINELKAKNTPKVWGSVQTGLVLSLLDGFNLASVAYSGNDLVVTIQSDLANTNYGVNVTLHGGTPGVALVTVKTVGTFTVRVWDMAGVQVDITAAGPAYRIDFTVFGVQT